MNWNRFVFPRPPFEETETSHRDIHWINIDCDSTFENSSSPTSPSPNRLSLFSPQPERPSTTNCYQTGSPDTRSSYHRTTQIRTTFKVQPSSRVTSKENVKEHLSFQIPQDELKRLFGRMRSPDSSKFNFPDFQKSPERKYNRDSVRISSPTSNQGYQTFGLNSSSSENKICSDFFSPKTINFKPFDNSPLPMPSRSNLSEISENQCFPANVSSLFFNVSHDEVPTNLVKKFTLREPIQRNFPKVFQTGYKNLYNLFCNNNFQSLKKEVKKHIDSALKRTRSKAKRLPILYLKSSGANSSRLIIFLHANGEDIVQAKPFLQMISTNMHINVIAPEYPGYSVYKGVEASEKRVHSDVEELFHYVVSSLGFDSQNVIVVGRSLGCCFALSVARKFSVNSLILISPFYDIRSTVKDMIGSFAQYFIKEGFKNCDFMKEVRSPVLIIHGDKDEVVSSRHSRKLFDLNIENFSVFYEVRNMGHNLKHLQSELMTPMYEFFKFLNVSGYDSIRI